MHACRKHTKSYKPEQKSAQDSPDDADDKVTHKAEAVALHDLACQPTCGQTDQQEVDQVHHWVSFKWQLRVLGGP
jgi:hypothetical protein